MPNIWHLTPNENALNKVLFIYFFFSFPSFLGIIYVIIILIYIIINILLFLLCVKLHLKRNEPEKEHGREADCEKREKKIK